MKQQELYELAGKLTDKEIAYLVASHLEHIKKSEFGFRITAGTGDFVGECRFEPKINS